MNLSRFALSHRTVVMVAVALVMATGLFNFATMSRREDPEILIRDCIVTTSWPGAPATKVEELVSDPLEVAIGEIDDVKEIKSVSRVGLSIITVTLEDAVKRPDQSWDEVRARVDRVRASLPQGARPPVVNADFGDVYVTCFALHQTPPPRGDRIERPYTPREMELLAEAIEDQLKTIDAVAKLDFWGVHDERIYVEVDSADWAKLSLTLTQLQNLFEARNIVAPGGQIDTASGSFAVKPTGEFTSVAQMSELVVHRRDGTVPVRIADLPLTIERRYVEPQRTITRLTTPEAAGTPCVVIGVAMKAGNNVVRMDADIDAALDRLRATALPPDVELIRVNDVPRQVDALIDDFISNLGQAIVLVLGVALLMMGLRPALIMATAVPLSMIAAFAVVRSFGVELEQFSIASLIIALGMVVDNAIVVSDNAVRLLREGRSKLDAAMAGAHDLAAPILTSTLTTVCAFLPMLALPGAQGEYIRSLPVVVAATLGASYFVAMLVTPLMCFWILKPQPAVQEKARDKPPRYDRVLMWCLDHKVLVLGSALLAFAGSQALGAMIGSQFFPGGERDQFFVHVWLPEGSPIAATGRVCAEVEEIVRDEADGRLVSAATFVGSGGPRLMLTQTPEQTFPYYGFVLVNTKAAGTSVDFAAAVRKRVAGIPGARIEVNNFMLGPPIKTPVAFRLGGPDAAVLREAAEKAMQILRATPGTLAVNSDWGASGYQVEVQVDSDAANLAGVTNADIAATMNSLVSGAQLTVFREGDHQVPVVFRSLQRNRENLNDLSGIYVSGAAGKIPLASLARLEPTWQPAVIARRDNIRTVTVGCRIEEGVLANDVTARLRPKMRALVDSLPPGYRLEVGGEQEETAKGQKNIANAMIIALGLIILVLVAQYNSLLKPLVILLTVPLALIGVMIGLFVTGWAMGFMAMLGVVSLAGIVINNAIVLIDFIETSIREGVPLRRAVAQAGRLRMRPIVLTSLTTIGGLAPLSLFGGPLWAPMANGMIFGLLVSTALTLVVVPTLYVLFAERFGMRTA